MKLVVVESPTKARTLSRYLGDGYVIEASMGHVRDLPVKGGMGIDIEKGFEPTYEIPETKKKAVNTLKKAAKGKTEIYLATDPDREGEAIAYHVAHILGKHDYKRVTFHEITKEAIEHAIEKPGKISMNLVDAQQARRVLDRLVGYTLSPVLWKKVRRGLSAGRVQSVAVRLIVEREEEIDKFKPQEYWDIFVSVEAKSGKFVIELTKKNGKPFKVEREKDAKEVIAELKKGKYRVVDVDQKKQSSSPPPPYTTSTLQQAASSRMGWSSKKTMSAAQALYERGYITYHRTDSFNLANSAVEAARKLIASEYGTDYVPEKARFYKTKSKSAQEAHEAIRPTNASTKPDDIKAKKMLEDQQKLYRMIRNRFLQCQMSDAVYDMTKVSVEASEKYGLEARGKVMIFDGWMKLGKSKDDEILPEISVGEELKYLDIDPQQKFTQPPARYTEASLIKELEKRGIGRPSTYASIISTIQDRMYVVKEDKKFQPTAVGTAVNSFLVQHFDKVMAYDFTAQMEDDLDEIADGKKEWVKVVGNFWDPFEKKVKRVEKDAKRVAVPVEKTGKKCPECKEGELVIRTGRYGKFLSCSRFPDCEYKDQYVEYVPGRKCPEDGGRIIERSTRRGSTFYGCENYPKCKWAIWKMPKKGEKLPTLAQIEKSREKRNKSKSK